MLDTGCTVSHIELSQITDNINRLVTTVKIDRSPQHHVWRIAERRQLRQTEYLDLNCVAVAPGSRIVNIQLAVWTTAMA